MDNRSSGRIIRSSRRVVAVETADGRVFEGRTLAKFKDLTVGDRVEFSCSRGEAVIESLYARRNAITRSYLEKEKTIATNVDHLFIVTAALPLFQPLFIDRILVCALYQDIPCTLVVNKSDLDLEETSKLIEIYSRAALPVVLTSVRSGEGILQLKSLLDNIALQVVLLCGISGVGKSSIITTLIPDAPRHTQEVSLKTGQGKQTTTQSEAIRYLREGMAPLYLIDSPGLQHFGLSKMTNQDVADGFKEISRLKSQCRFADCNHTVEKDCAVLAAIERQEIHESRYASYRHILAEIERARPY